MVQDHKLLGADRDEQMSISDGNFTGWGLSTCRSNGYGILGFLHAQSPLKFGQTTRPDDQWERNDLERVP